MMNKKSVLSLSVATSVLFGTLLAPPKLKAQITPEQDEVGRYIDHARDIVQRIRMGLKHCTAKGDSIECASPKSPPMKCTFVEETHGAGWWPSTTHAALDCEVNGAQLGLAVDYIDFPVPRDEPPRDIEYREEGETSEAFRIDVPTFVVNYVPFYVASCTAVQTKGDYSFLNGCTERLKSASERVNSAAIQVMNRAARILRKESPKK